MNIAPQSVPSSSPTRGDGSSRIRTLGTTAELRFRRTLAATMKNSGKNRVLIAREMTEILGLSPDRAIKKGLLDDCVRRRKKGRMVRFPAAWVPALCQVTQNDELQRQLLTDRLRDLLAVGESVTGAVSRLAEAQGALARIMRQSRQKAKVATR